MAVAYQATATNSVSANTVTATLGVAPTDGDVLYAVVITNSAAAQPINAGTAGWVSLKTQAGGGGNQTALFRLVASSSGTGHTFTCTDATFMEVLLVRYNGNNAAPEDALSTSNGGTAATIAFPDITSVSSNTRHLIFAVDTAGLPTMPGGSYTNRAASANFWRAADAAIATPTAITGVTGSGGTAWATYSVLIREPSTGPNIVSVDDMTPEEGTTLVVTGTALKASGNSTATIGGVSQPITTQSATVPELTTTLGTLKFGTTYNLVITDSDAAASNSFALTSLQPAAGRSFVDVGTPNPDADLRLTSTADLASGDQIEYDNKGGLVTVYNDATFEAGPGVSSFSFRVWTSGSGYGQSATQLTTLGGGATDRPIIRPFNKRSGLGF